MELAYILGNCEVLWETVLAERSWHYWNMALLREQGESRCSQGPAPALVLWTCIGQSVSTQLRKVTLLVSSKMYGNKNIFLHAESLSYAHQPFRQDLRTTGRVVFLMLAKKQQKQWEVAMVDIQGLKSSPWQPAFGQ
jgi:hypothetical protein